MKARYWYDLQPGVVPVFDLLTEPTVRTWKPYRGWISQTNKGFSLRKRHLRSTDDLPCVPEIHFNYGVILVSRVPWKDIESWIRTRIAKLNRPRGILLIYVSQMNEFDVHLGLVHQTRKMEDHEWGMENDDFSIRKGKAIPLPAMGGFFISRAR